ncbi:TonB-dependent receptor [Altererythrobacter arenosus]|uniref:TonB-dependent receptor n=1 Tax=Altererythrobacter arenosus TaxID=3032592 RepID=A0ABY8FXD2_9SPHN|nr:TonB-dependent receptor [Altererythrobacter sp. CAU 1644]WFL78061.1 TonB-dependent receptor [Altererythrobacter sp. CAU 1644]
MKKSFLNGLCVTTAMVAVSALSAPAFAQDGELDSATSTEGDEAPIIVTGSRIARPDIESPSPVTVVGSEDIKLEGTTRIEDILNSLPSVAASQDSSYANGASGTATVDLRALGTSRTLALINGRRIVPGDPQPGSGSAADINIIPAALLKRVEVLTGGASSVYGADAVAGVVNFIMDDDFEGFRVDANYGFYQHNNNNKFVRPFLDARGFPFPDGNTTDGGTFDATVAFGSNFADDRGHFMMYGGYRKIQPVTQSRRDFSSCVIQNTSSGANQCGGSATTPNGNALVFDDDVTVGTSTFYTFAPNRGFVNGLDRFNFAPFNFFQRNDERFTAGAFVDYEVSDVFRPYMEFQFMDDQTTAQIAPSGDFGNTLTVNCDNPLLGADQLAVICSPENLINGFLGTFPLAVGASYNPNPGAPVIDFADGQGGTYNQGYLLLLRRNIEGGPRRAQLGHTTYRGVLGATGDLGPAWSYDAYYQYGRVDFSQVYENEFSIARLNNALDAVVDNRAGSATNGQIVCRSVITGADPNCVPYDVFAGAGGASAAALAYLDAAGFQSGETIEQVANISFTGDLGQYGAVLPWADDGIVINVGAEWRKEQLELRVDQAFATGDLTGQGGATLPIAGEFKVLEFFAEGSIPVIQDSFIDLFAISAGYRRSDYDTSAGKSYGTNTYKLGAEIAPIEDVRFRVMYNRAVRAPNIEELFRTAAVGLNGSNDPCAGITITATDFGCLAQGLSVGQGVTGNPAGQYNALLGGNPDLQPEKASTWTAGVVFDPVFLPGFTATLDYFNIEIDDAIRQFGPDAILQNCVDNASATFTPASCGLVNRDAAGSLWLTPGGFTEDLPNNVGRVQTAGFEGTMNYTRSTGIGRIGLSFTGTYLDKYEVQNGLTNADGSPVIYDCAGFYGPTCSLGGGTDAGAPLPKWRHKLRASLGLDSGLSFSVLWRHVGKVRAETLSSDDALSSANTFDPGLRIGAFNYIDTVVSFDIGDRYNFRIGVNNLFDKEPPLVTSGSSARAGTNLCPTGPCNGNTYPATWDALGRYIFAGVTLDF